ncbi:hypothetical protein [Thiobacillus thioparus]|uniref:hypothetical protein n=1 Tax=Thiobacillus thioparus TaxID=931 RepID=UPI0012F73B65|nr:hypothetical protein [Thiobacillus thioparus]
MTLILTCTFAGALAEDLQIVPYENTYKCPAAVVHTTGMRCEIEDTCPTVSPIQSEKADLTTNSGKKFSIPSLIQSFPKSTRILRDEGSAKNPQPRIYGIENVTCLGKNKIGILYNGGGNCRSGCENYVTYTISQDKGITNASIAE